MLTILEGSTFCISDDRGDIAAETSGFFAHDTRFLSRLVLTVGGSAPLLLSSGRVEHFRAAFYLRNGTATGLPRDSISIARERFVGTGMQERIALRNESPERLEIDVALEAEADFADIISVKHHDFSLGDPDLAQKLPPPAPTTHDESRRQVSIVDPQGDLGTRLVFSKPGRLDGNAMTFALTLEPHERWEVSVDVLPWLDEELETLEPSTRSARARATSSLPGRFVSRACAEDGRTCAARSTARSATSPPCGCGRASSVVRSSPPGCRGS